MGEQVVPFKVLLTGFGIVFSLGVFCGYQLKSWRIEWLKRRRDRLARKIQATQAEINQLQTH